MSEKDTLVKNIPLMLVNLSEEDIEEVANVLRTGMLVQGKNVEKLENALKSYLGVKNVIAASNGTATLHMALIALGIKEGDEVIVPAFSYIATANVVELVGATPVFVDIELETFNLNVKQVEDKITNRTKAIIPVHEFGLISDMEALKKIGNKKNIYIIEDAACALGATLKGQHSGTFGNIGSFSLHPRKAITSGEGGLLTTNDDELARKLRILRNHGIEYTNGKMEFVAAGFNYRMTDFQAALVHSQFNRLESMLGKKRALAAKYHDLLKNIPHILQPIAPKNFEHSWQTYHVVLSDNIDRNQLIADLKKEGIGTNYGAQCIPLQLYYQEKYKLNSYELFPNAVKAFLHGLALPLYSTMSILDIERVVNTLTKLIFETNLNE